jgi:membrane associated rhomboid family serine protease
MFLIPESRYKCASPPVATVALIALNTLLWVALWMMSYPQELFSSYGFVAARPYILTLVSAMFLHPSILYLAPNMIFLFAFGKQLEDGLGHLLFLTIFALSALAGTGLFYALDRVATTPCTGSTGAVAGIVGAFWIMFPTQIFDVEVHLGWWHVTTFAAKTFAAIGAWFGMQVIVLIIAYRLPTSFLLWSNIGGFAAGLTVGFLLKSNLQARPSDSLSPL